MNTANALPTVLVVGATGFLGTEICRQLTAAGKKVKGLVRAGSAAEKVEQLQALGAATVVGDIKDRALLDNAMQGVTHVISTATAIGSQKESDTLKTVDEQGQMNVIDAAKAAGVQQFVFISVAPLHGTFPLQTAKRKAEDHLVQSGLAYTILQPTMFMEIWLSPMLGFDAANARATIYGRGKNKHRWISAKDVAAIAVASLDNPLAENKIFELGGPEALSQLEVVALFEESSGKKFELQFVPEEALEAQQAAATNDLTRSFAGLMLACARGTEINIQPTIAAYDIRFNTVRDYARQTAGQATMAG